MDTAFAIKLFGALFAIMNPVTNLPVFLSVTDGQSPQVQRAVAVKTTVYVVIMGSVMAVGGPAILKLFGISVDDLRVAGGLVVLLIALNMLHGEQSSSHHGSAAEKETPPDPGSVAFYPLTFPILVGPGTITTLIVFAGQANGPADHIALAVVFGGLSLLIGVVFAFGAKIGSLLSASARSIMSRLMGMILAAIAVDMMATGLKALLPGLG